MGTPCHVPITCTCPVYLHVPWSDHPLLSPCSRFPSGHQCTTETSWVTCALLHCSVSRYQDGLSSPWKPEHTTGRRLHLILLPDQEVHSRHPQYHDIGWASNPDLWTLSWFITHLQAELPAYSALSHKGLAILPCYHPFLAILPCASMDCSTPVIRAIPPLPRIMMRP